MVKVKCLRCGSVGYSASPNVTCHCGGGCKGDSPISGQEDQQSLKVDYDVVDLVATLLRRLV